MRVLTHSTWFLGLLCVLLIGARMSGAHWHLCNDGNEPPRALHTWDGAIDDHTEPSHSDTNLNLVDDGLSKTMDKALDMPALPALLALFCVLVLVPRRTSRIDYQPPFFPATPYSLSAQPRAPPR